MLQLRLRSSLRAGQAERVLRRRGARALRLRRVLDRVAVLLHAGGPAAGCGCYAIDCWISANNARSSRNKTGQRVVEGEEGEEEEEGRGLGT